MKKSVGPNAWGQDSKTAKRVRREIRESKKQRSLQKTFRKRGYGLP